MTDETMHQAPVPAETVELPASTAGVLPSPDESAPEPLPDRPDRRWAVVTAVAAALLAAVILVAVLVTGDGDVDDTATSPPTTSEPAVTSAPSTTPTPSATDPPAATNPPASTPTTAPSAGLPTNPEDYAVATMTAWQQDDVRMLKRLADPSVTAFLLAHDDDRDWGTPQFEGAAGSTYASWSRPEAMLVMRIGNEAASNGAPHAVREAYYTSGEGRVALWPFTTQAEADDDQAAVDAGHQPWQADPGAVAAAYATADPGWRNPEVTATKAGQYDVTDRQSGTTIHLVLAQPARTGDGGIWAVARAGSAESR